MQMTTYPNCNGRHTACSNLDCSSVSSSSTLPASEQPLNSLCTHDANDYISRSQWSTHRTLYFIHSEGSSSSASLWGAPNQPERHNPCHDCATVRHMMRATTYPSCNGRFPACFLPIYSAFSGSTLPASVQLPTSISAIHHHHPVTAIIKYLTTS